MSLLGELDASRGWYLERGQGRLFNAWSLTHVAWGGLAYAAFGRRYWPGLVLHTVYEFNEHRFWPREGRDRSRVNHMGDTLAFVGGQVATAWLLKS